MTKKKNNQSWQTHLDQLEDDKSADKYFIKQFKQTPAKDFFDQANDYLISPLINKNFEETPDEGQLTIDVYQTKDNIIIKSTLAGVDPQDLSIALDNEVLTIKGERKKEKTIEQQDYFYQECYWGKFSRSIILPLEVKADKIKAIIKNGVLTITLPKVKKTKTVKIKIQEIE